MKNKGEGFTLIEIILALFLISLVLMTLAGICFPLKSSIVQAKNREQVQETVQALLNRLNEDLQFAWEPGGIKDSFFSGVNHKMTFYCLDSVRFSGKPFIPGTRKVEVVFEKGEGALYWRETPLAVAQEKREFYLLGKQIKNFQIRYWADSGWANQWNDKLWPRAIEVTGIYLDGLEKEVFFEQTFYPRS